MKLETFNNLCRDLYTNYKADPYELFLTSASRLELSKDAIDSENVTFTHDPAYSQIAGLRVETLVNPVTKNTVDVRDSENNFDSMVVELWFAA